MGNYCNSWMPAPPINCCVKCGKEGKMQIGLCYNCNIKPYFPSETEEEEKEDLFDVIKIIKICDGREFTDNLKGERYYDESLILSFLCNDQLNSEKNKIKPPIEDMSYSEIMDKCLEELEEIKIEVSHYESNNSNMYRQRVLEEIGDLAGMLAGLIAKVVKE